jgi:transcription antitermination factor NusG
MSQAQTARWPRSDPETRAAEPARWYVAHLQANHEKRAAEELRRRSVEHYLPLYASVRRWKDRRITLNLPLFPGYLFVRIPLSERLRVLGVPSVARLVGFAGPPVALPDAEIDTLREKLGRGARAEPCAYLAIGRRVRVTRGPMEGLEGFLVARRKKSRIVISIDAIQRSIAAEVELTDVEPVQPRIEGRPA